MNNPPQLKQLVLNHILPSALFTNDEKAPLKGLIQAIGGASIPFEKTANGDMFVGTNKAKIIFANRAGNNGINHIVNGVIMS